jgi:hypothetical protein
MKWRKSSEELPTVFTNGIAEVVIITFPRRAITEDYYSEEHKWFGFDKRVLNKGESPEDRRVLFWCYREDMLDTLPT